MTSTRSAIAIEEEFQKKREQLESSGGGQTPDAWQELDQAEQQRHEALQEQYQALDRETRNTGTIVSAKTKIVSVEEIGNQRDEFEAEADRRRNEEGDDFDEEAYEFELGHDGPP